MKVQGGAYILDQLTRSDPRNARPVLLEGRVARAAEPTSPHRWHSEPMSQRGFASTLSALSIDAAAPAERPPKADVEAEFLDWSAKNPAERIRAALLRELGLSEEELAALPPAEREAVAERIAEAVKRQYGLDHAARGDETVS